MNRGFRIIGTLEASKETPGTFRAVFTIDEIVDARLAEELLVFFREVFTYITRDGDPAEVQELLSKFGFELDEDKVH